MIELKLIGIGTGNPEHLTLEAVRALQGADLLLLPRKGDDKADLADLRRTICAAQGTQDRTVEFDLPKRDAANPAYLDGVNDWHDAIAATWADLIARHLPQGGTVALLVWGDPSLYDSSLRIAERLAAAGIGLKVNVIAGITSLQLLTACHAIPLNTLGGEVVITTGRRLRQDGWPGSAETVVVMLDAGGAFEVLDPEGTNIYWGAYLGMPFEIALSGPLAETAPLILAARAKAREAHGWIMDIYLLRRPG
ncbi:MAG: precorrin-6A synthase (deacetylating) [Cereibacter sphaeroides]|uniref:Precorrin-6A synthase [deacetylating] n=1 Tax=Cereibacter sphaeroides TaxID=1063 RepID=A0A2W5TTN4_CERSP|nr:MAG: precorrin-6A synthase (deacetylating) [Cereibacter sphaeroides]